jgi:hypothetical protein
MLVELDLVFSSEADTESLPIGEDITGNCCCCCCCCTCIGCTIEQSK